MKKYQIIFFSIFIPNVCYSQPTDDSVLVQTLTFQKGYWSLFYADSLPKLINGQLYIGIDSSYIIEGGEKLLTLEVFKDGYKVEAKAYFDNGNLACHYQFKNGKREGISKRFYKSGKIMYDEEIKFGKIFGTSILYYENGNPQSIFDNKNRIAIRFFENGRVKSLVKYLDSTECENTIGYEETQWLADGALNFKIKSNCGKQFYRSYYNDSTIFWEETIIDMPLFLVGNYTKWYRNGNLAIKGQYEDGNTQSEANIKTGIWKYFDEKENLIKEEEYKKNVLIRSKEFKKKSPIKN